MTNKEETANFSNFINEPFEYNNYLNFFKNDPISFWDEIGKKYVKWNKMYEKVYSGDEKNPNWYDGGELNVCYNALDVHINNPERRDQIAIIHECPVLNISNKLTYFELWNKVCIFSRALKNLGIKKGDGVMIYMPTTIEAMIAMLSCARLGAIHCVVFAGFSASNLALRFDHFKPKLLITSNCSISGLDIIEYSPFVNNALELSTYKPENIIIYNRCDIKFESRIKIKNSIDWNELIKDLEPLLEYTIVESNHPLYLLYTSGTTGLPKGIIIRSGGFVAAANHSLRNIYGLKEGVKFFSASDIGWQLGHNITVYGLPIIGGTGLLFEGETIYPTPNTYFKIIEKHQFEYFFTVPGEIKSIRKEDPNGLTLSNLNLSSLKLIILCGEKLDSTTLDYLKSTINKPVFDNYGQTEGSWVLVTSPSFQIPFRFKSAGKVVPGYNLSILNKQGLKSEPNEIGEIVVKLPLPPSFVNTLYLNENGLNSSYLKKYNGYYCTGDLGYYDKDDYFYIVSRTDDQINVGGDPVFCGLCEEVILKHPFIIDCVVIGINDDVDGNRACGLIIFKQQKQEEFNDEFYNQVLEEINEKLDDSMGYICKLKYLIPVNSIPKTRSGKKIRHLLSKIFNGEQYQIPPSIQNIDVLTKIDFDINQFKLKNKIIFE